MVMIELNKNINGLSVGDVLEFISGETFVRQDIHSWSKRTGHDVLDTSERNGVCHYLIRKGERIRRFQDVGGRSPAWRKRRPDTAASG